MAASMRIFLLVAITTLAYSDALKVTVLYESKCPYSAQFVTRQLYPWFYQFTDYIDLELVPYGKANQTKENGIWRFNCQHGPDECLGNKFQACAISLSTNQWIKISVISCILRQPFSWTFTTVQQCAIMFNLDISQLNQCVFTTTGDELLASSGQRTSEFKITEIPTIIFDDKFNATLNIWARANFPAVLCSKITGQKPSICYYNLDAYNPGTYYLNSPTTNNNTYNPGTYSPNTYNNTYNPGTYNPGTDIPDSGKC